MGLASDYCSFKSFPAGRERFVRAVKEGLDEDAKNLSDDDRASLDRLGFLRRLSAATCTSSGRAEIKDYW
jgi:hypothetical protein